MGKIENFSLVFISIVNFSGNASGIIYKDISKLLLSNAGWFGNNSGTFETFQGTFGLIGKVGGFSEVIGTNIGVDVSSNPIITGDAIMETVLFTGTLTSGQYVKGYSPAVYTGFNFNNKWAVRCAGIPLEADGVAIGDINIDYPVGSGAATTLSGTPVKLAGTTTSSDLFRFTTDGGVNNRLKYVGTKSRYFRVGGSISFQSSSNGAVYIFYIAKNGTPINSSKVYVTSNSPTDIIAMPIVVMVPMATNDYIEVFATRYSGTGNILTISLNLTVN
ncbi:hypothetical protein [Flavobacterium sp. GT3R68]|uniref:hypothetical protein n=1 Tax=Flavobacterium sp. GT3R68 TaxID=2594437 RepID=UPI002106A924|nr:hypothetical protein [Flavobacterium sp. GT3R68]